MDSAAINSFIPTLDQVDSWYEIFAILPILISLELLLSAYNAIALASLTKSLDSSQLRTKALNIGITISLAFRILLILLSNILLKFIFIRIFAGLYLIYLFITNVFFNSELDSDQNVNVDSQYKYKFALRFTSGLFLRLLDKFTRLETSGYIAILIVGIKLLLNTLIKETILPDYYLYILIFTTFIWGFSKKELDT